MKSAECGPDKKQSLTNKNNKFGAVEITHLLPTVRVRSVALHGPTNIHRYRLENYSSSFQTGL